jgi:hypothetical protein
VNTELYVQDDWKVTPRLTVNLGLRWSWLPSVTDVKDTLSNFDPHLYNSQLAPQIDPDSGNFVAGQAVNGVNLIPATYTNGIIFPRGTACSNAKAISPFVQCSPFGLYVNPNYKSNFAPRVGFSYDLTGRNRTVLRGGFGIFYDRLLNGIWEQNAFSNPPLAQSTTINNAPFDNIKGGSTAVSYGPNSLTATGTPQFRVPNYANYNMSIQHQVTPSTVVEVAYVGALARHLLGQFDENQPTVADRLANTTADVNYLRPYKGYARITSRFPSFTNNYNSLQVSANHRSHGLTLGTAYTWSKDLTVQSYDRSNMATNSYDFKLDYGPASYNTPHVLSANAVYDLPFYQQQQGFVGRVLGGWEASGILTATSGSNFSVTQSADPFESVGPRGIGVGGVRPDQVAPIHKSKSFDKWFSTESFAQANGHFGSERSNPIIGPGFQNWDLAGIKNFRLIESVNFQFRAEFFNAFNHVNPYAPDAGIDDSDYGRITGGHSPRRIQFGAKLTF